ncbi:MULTISPECIES: LytR C-terminal domain-containing protein [unclassified Rathayibacter]|uniref:LytR C-terminal domain-containing protein n=1 Tax=unclassified Rathayibacter TaxID=2609250 RepID=UPI00188BBFD9|nr:MULTISPECIES: LytR C-terminal domain-containing protein [unclassified Rathayibacter]MBF4461730.1 LytR C-terminal domain-containing protein [Rathayibacter sp. VKM Ac-2879]MBF4503141.1 LytR C-terminal domain-containing protein [Rathayibacter sp. VKM Ac-2878]
MTNTHPRDRFDELSAIEGRVGAHRRPPARYSRLIAFAWAALATGVIVLLGFIGLLVIDDRVEFNDVFTPPSSAPETSQSATVAPTVDPAASVAVLNGTATVGLAARAGDVLTAAGWTVPTVTNANTEDEAVTTIYYSDSSLEGAARGLAQTLGVGTLSQTQDFVETGPLVVVLGADFPTG